MWKRVFFSIAGSALSVTLLQAASVADAAAARDFVLMRKLLSERVNAGDAQADGTTALHWAAHWNDLDSVKMLLKAGADAKA